MEGTGQKMWKLDSVIEY